MKDTRTRHGRTPSRLFFGGRRGDGLQVTPRTCLPAADAHLQSTFALARDEEEIALAPGDNVLGRDPSASVRIGDDTVSRRHARINVTSRDATIEDLGSKNGTFVEGRRTGGKPLPLADGDQIQVGSVFLAFRVRSSEKSTRTFRGRRRP
jgi:hypothetical protein